MSSVDVKEMQSKLTDEYMSRIKVIQVSCYPGEKGQSIAQQQKMVVQGWYLMQKKALERKASLMLSNDFINFWRGYGTCLHGFLGRGVVRLFTM